MPRELHDGQHANLGKLGQVAARKPWGRAERKQDQHSRGALQGQQ